MEKLGYTIRAMAATTLEDEWRSAMMEYGEESVTRRGITMLPPWPAESLAMETIVSHSAIEKGCHS